MSILNDIKNTLILSLEKHSYVFFSESKFYQKYLIVFIKKLSLNKKEIIYLSQDKTDIIDIKNVKNYCIKNSFLCTVLLNIIQAKIVFMTITDLGYNQIKKSKFVEKYIYIFHSPISTNKSYTKTAFQAYDEIFCIGDYQYNELVNSNIQKNKLTKIGYFYFDYLKNNIVYDNINSEDTILIAPSWNLKNENFFTIYCSELVNNLVKRKKYKIILRPHPEHFKRNISEIDKIVDENKNFKNFYLDQSDNNLASLKESNILITDNSGIFIEYLFIFHKPVIFFDKYDKIHNSNYTKSNLKNFEESVKDEFCVKYSNPNFENIEIYINDSKNKLNKKKDFIENFAEKNIYNFGNASEAAEKYIIKKYNL